MLQWRIQDLPEEEEVPTRKGNGGANILLPPATKLGQGYVFTGVCDSVHRGGST